MTVAYAMLYFKRGDDRPSSCDIFSDKHPTSTGEGHWWPFLDATGKNFEDARDNALTILRDHFPHHYFLIPLDVRSAGERL